MRAMVPMVCVLALGCVEFAGDRGAIGFASNLVVDGAFHWQPGVGVADGTAARFIAVDRLDEEGEQEPDVQGRAKGLQELPSEPGTVTVTGVGDRGQVRFDGEVADRFGVAFRGVADGFLVDPLLAFVRADAAYPDAFGVVGPLPVAVALRDGRGRPLGYDPDALVVAGVDAAVWSTEEDGMVLHATDVMQPLVIDTGTDRVDGPEVVQVAAAEVVALSVESFAVEDEGVTHTLLRAVGWTADDLPVFGLDVAWAWEGEGEVQAPTNLLLATDPDSVRAQWADLEATLD